MAKRTSVARRTFYTLTALFAAVIAGVALSLYFTVARTVEETVLGTVTRDMALAARDFETWLTGKTATLRTLRLAVLRFGDDPAAVRALLGDATEADEDIPWIYYGTAARGEPYSEAGPGLVMAGDGYYADGSGWTPPPGYDWTVRPWFEQSRTYPDPVVSEPYVDEGTGERVVSVSLACRDGAGTLVGVLAADVRLSRLTTVVSMRRFAADSRTYLVDREGFLVTGEERLNEAPLIATGNLFEPGSPIAGLRDTMASVDGTSGLLRGAGLYYASARVAGTHWLVVSVGPLADVAAPVFNFYRSLIVVSLFAMAAAVLFAVAESRVISTPIRLLKDGAIALAAGDLSHRVDLRTDDEFGELAVFFNRVAASLKADIDRMAEQRLQIELYSQTLERDVADRTRELNEANLMLRLRNDQMEEEVQMAAAVQRKIVPTESELPRSSELAFGARYLAMANVGGDLYDVLDLGKGIYALVVGDVSGHGIPAALIAAMVKVSFKAHCARDRGPAAILASVNAELCELIGDETYFVSAFLAILDSSTGELAFANAGHPPALLRRASGAIEELDVAEGQLLGISDVFVCGSRSVRMEPGDRLLLYTDGIIEARSPGGGLYDLSGLSAFFGLHGAADPAAFAGSLLEDVRAFCAGVDQADDRAVLVVGLERLAGRAADRPAAECDPLSEADRMVSSGLSRDTRSALEEIRRRRPEDHRVMNALAIARLEAGDAAGAERLLRTAVRLAPDMAEYANNLAAVLSAGAE